MGAPTSSAAAVAHVLRRLTFGPSAAQVARFAAAHRDDPAAAAAAAVRWALDAPPLPVSPARLADDGDQWDAALRGWVDTMRSSEAGLHEKMTWFWHGHFTTSSDKVGNLQLLHAQQALLRRHALGSFAELLRAMLTDAAMLLYLDGSGSAVDAPNENLARELLELFTLGRGNYREADVRAAALALAGFQVDYDSGKVTFDASRALGGEVELLGRRGRLGVDQVVETVLAQPACAVFVAAKLHAFLVGTTPSPARAAELGDVFRGARYEIRPLVEAVVRHPDFRDARLARPRYPIEWYVAAGHALGPLQGDDQDLRPWTLRQLDQLPYAPPNVAGWPPGPRWLGASQQLARAAYAASMAWQMAPLTSRDLVGEVLERCAIHEPGGPTRRALSAAALATAGSADAASVGRRLLTTALCAPEFALA